MSIFRTTGTGSGSKVTTGVRATTGRPGSTEAKSGIDLKAALARKKIDGTDKKDQVQAPAKNQDERRSEPMDARTLQRMVKRLAYLKRNRPATGAAEIREIMDALNRHRGNLHRSRMG